MSNRPPQTLGPSRYLDLFREWERGMLRDCLARHRNNQCAVARELGLHRNTVRRMVNLHGLGRRERKTSWPASLSASVPFRPAPTAGMMDSAQ